MLGGPYRPRVVPVPSEDVGRGPRNGTADVHTAAPAVTAASSTTATPRCGIPWSRLYSAAEADAPVNAAAASPSSPTFDPEPLYHAPRLPSGRAAAGTYTSPTGHHYHDDERPPALALESSLMPGNTSTSVSVPAAASAAATRRYQQLASLHRYGAAHDSNGSNGAAPAVLSSSPTRTSVASAAPEPAIAAPTSILRYTDARGRPAHSTAPNAVVRQPAEHPAGAINISASATTSAPPPPPPAPQSRTTSAHSQASSSSSVAAKPSSTPAAAAAAAASAAPHTRQGGPLRVDLLARRRSSAASAPRGRQRSASRQRTRSTSSSRAAAPATSARQRRRASSPASVPRTAQWAVKLIEDFVHQVAVQQDAAASAPIIAPGNAAAAAAAAASVRRRASGPAVGADIAAALASGEATANGATTVADLVATFLASRHGALHWRPILHSFAACLHRYRRLSPTCAVFREYFIDVRPEALHSFHLFCRLYAAADTAHCTSVEVRRVPLTGAAAAAPTASPSPATHTIVSRRYLDTREAADRLLRVLRRVVLVELAPCLVVGDAGAAGGFSTSRCTTGQVQYRFVRDAPARTATVPQRRRLTADEVREVRKVVLAWLEESTHRASRSRSAEVDNAATGVEDDDAEGELERVSFDREGCVDVYAFLQATLEAVKLICMPSRRTSLAKLDAAAAETLEEEEEEEAPADAMELGDGADLAAADAWQSGRRTARSPQVTRNATPPPSYAYPLPDKRPGRRVAVSSPPRPPSGRSRHAWAEAGEGGGASAAVADDGGASAPLSRSVEREPSYMRPRSSVAAHASAARISADGRLWSPPRRELVAPASASQHRRRSPSAARPSPPRSRAAFNSQRARSPGVPGGNGAVTPSAVPGHGAGSPSPGTPYTHHPYITQLHGAQRWAVAQEAAAAAALQRREACWREHYPRAFNGAAAAALLDDGDDATHEPRDGVRATPTAAAPSLGLSTSVDLTLDAIEAELRRREARGGAQRDMRVPLQTRHPAVDALYLTDPQEARYAAAVVSPLPREKLQSFGYAPLSATAVAASPARLVAARAAPSSAHAIRVETITPAPSPGGAARAAPYSTTTPAAPTSASPVASMPRTMQAGEVDGLPRGGVASPSGAVAAASMPAPSPSSAPVARDAVMLTEEEQAMLDQLEVALHRLDAQHRRSHMATDSAAAGGGA